MSDDARLRFKFLAAIGLAAGGFLLLTQFPPVNTEHSAIASASGLVLMGLAALVLACADRTQSPR